MGKRRMTNAAVERFTCGVYTSGTRKGQVKEQDTLWDAGEDCVKGLGMRLSSKSGTRTFIFVFRVKGGKEIYQTIGRYGDGWRLDCEDPAWDPRAKARELKQLMRQGVNPIAKAEQELAEQRAQEAKEKALATTLKEVLEHYLTHHRTKHGPLRPATQKDMRRHCEKNLTSWLELPVAGITRDACLAKFTELSARAPQQANLCMVYLRALLNHAREMHATEDGQFPVLAVNPVSRLWKLKKPNPEKPRKTRIPLAKVGRCWNWLRKVATEARMETERTAADWLCFVLLTGTRRLESGSLRWTDCDFEAKTITLHGDVEGEGGFAGVKNHNTIVLPMSSVLAEILTARKSPAPLNEKVARRRRVQRAKEYVFASNGKKTPFITNAQATVEALSKIAGAHVHLHALRRTTEDIAQACKIDSDVRRMLLNHISGDVHAIHYANGESVLAAAAESMAQWIVQQATIAASENVVPFPARRTG
jgi:integrase